MRLGAEGGMGEQGVAVQGEELKNDGGNEQAGLDLPEVANGIAEPGDEGQHEEVDDKCEDHPPQGFQHFLIVRRDMAPAPLTTVGP